MTGNSDILLVDRPMALESTVYDYPYVCRELSQKPLQQAAIGPAMMYRVKPYANAVRRSVHYGFGTENRCLPAGSV